MPALRHFGWPRRGLRARGAQGAGSVGGGLPFGGHPTLSDGLAAYWSFDDGGAGPGEVGGFTFTTVGAVVPAAAKVGNGAQIPYSAYLSHAYNATLNVGSTGNGASVSIWANSGGADDSSPFITWDDGAFTPSLGLYYNAGNVRFLISDDTGTTKNIFSGFSLAAWHHLVGTFNEGGDKLAKLYVDGALVATSTATTTGTLESMVGFPLVLGAVFGGAIAMAVIADEVGLWDRAVVAAEVTYLYNGGAGRAY